MVLVAKKKDIRHRLPNLNDVFTIYVTATVILYIHIYIYIHVFFIYIYV